MEVRECVSKCLLIMIKMIRTFAAWPSRWAALLLFISHACAAGLFCTGFLLTRIELPERTSPLKSIPEAPLSEAPVHKTVWMIIDALRWDFVNHASSHDVQQSMPIMHILQDTCAAAGPACMLAKFVADAPTTTMQRLKGLMTGGLPTFIDIGSSFSAAAVTEDNLVDQLHTNNKRLAFVGDDTWMQLFPTQFAEALPYPSFEVHDLHTVDDGVWQNLVPRLQQPSEWDVLIGHYLGVDHVGHTFDVHSQHMHDKLLQMNQHVAQVIESLVGMAGPGSVHEHTMLLVFGDHGQTLTGDHGGGAPEEVDTAIFALHMGAYFEFRQGDMQQQPEQASHEQVIPQVDFAPTMAALLGVPTPFGSIGKLSPGLWNVGHSLNDSASQASYMQALQSNAQQVHTYLTRYAEHPRASIPQAALAKLNQLYTAAWLPASGQHGKASQSETEQAASMDRFAEYLEAAAQFARQQWAQFNMPLMVLGMILLTASLLLQAASLLTSLPTWPWTYPSHQLWQSILPAGIIMLCLLHALGLLSTSFILGEGQMACFLVATMALLLLHCAVGASMHPAASEVYIHAKTQHTAATVTGNQRDLTHTVGLIDKNANRCSFEQMFQCTSDKRQHYRGCNEAVMWGLGIMMCNAVLGCTGLVTRTGHDAMHKAAAGKAFLSPDVHTSISQHNAAVPVFLGVDAFCASLHWLSDGLQQTQALIVPALCVLSFPLVLLGGVCTSERTQHNTSRMTLLEVDSVEYFVWLAYGAIATLWVVQGQSLGHLPLLACVPASLQRQQSSILRLLHVLCQQPVVSTLMTRPLNVLLPELVFGLVLSSLALNGLCSISAYVNKRNTHQPNSYVWTAILIAPVLLVLGSSFALISILALAQCICIKQLFCSLYTASSLATGQDIARPSKGMTAPSGWVNVAEGGAWTLISTQLFFCTGHFCEFAGLQYSAGFVGLTSFSWYASGFLLALNTFGPQIVVIAAMSVHGDGMRPGSSQHHAKRVSAMFLLIQTLKTWIATCGVALQRRHLMVWALFAPKFVFELCFLAVADLSVLMFE